MLFRRWLKIPIRSLGSTVSAIPDAIRKSGRSSARLLIDVLENRENPSLTIQIDYRFDNGYFTSGDSSAAQRRATIEQAASDIGSQINTPLAAITPGGVNTWTAEVFNPANPNTQVSITNLNVPQNTIVVFVSGGAGSDGEAGLGGYGGYSASGTSSWINTILNRGPGSFTVWGGAISFDMNTNWNFGMGTPASNQLDFYTASIHELAHVFGFGTAPLWNSIASSGHFNGSYATAVYGSAPPVSTSDPGHWRQGMIYNGDVSVMQPALSFGKRLGLNLLDYASLADIGWNVLSLNSAASAGTTPVSKAPIVSGTTSTVPSFAATTPGNVQLFNAAGGNINATSGGFNPYPGFGGSIRTALGDVNGDGTPDLITAPGPGGGPLVNIYDGRSGALVSQFYAFESYFRGGVFVATGDFNQDGRTDIVVGADIGGGPRVRVLSGADVNATLADFWGIDDPDFRGGVRVAVGDLNSDGRPDLIVAAGAGGGPRISTYDGRTWVRTSDFFAFELNLTNGSYVASGDLDGDGYAELILGAGEGGGPRIKAISGKLFSTFGIQTALSAPTLDYYCGDPFNPSGIRVASNDVNGDGLADVIAGSGINSVARVQVNGINWSTAASIGGVYLINGVYVG